MYKSRSSRAYELTSSSFVAVLFVDALQRMFRITAEATAAKSGGNAVSHDVRAETNFAARKF